MMNQLAFSFFPKNSAASKDEQFEELKKQPSNNYNRKKTSTSMSNFEDTK